MTNRRKISRVIVLNVPAWMPEPTVNDAWLPSEAAPMRCNHGVPYPTEGVTPCQDCQQIMGESRAE